jgi:hypothetical protein
MTGADQRGPSSRPRGDGRPHPSVRLLEARRAEPTFQAARTTKEGVDGFPFQPGLGKWRPATPSADVTSGNGRVGAEAAAHSGAHPNARHKSVFPIEPRGKLHAGPGRMSGRRPGPPPGHRVPLPLRSPKGERCRRWRHFQPRTQARCYCGSSRLSRSAQARQDDGASCWSHRVVAICRRLGQRQKVLARTSGRR